MKVAAQIREKIKSIPESEPHLGVVCNYALFISYE